jgi:hypothetical protein
MSEALTYKLNCELRKLGIYCPIMIYSVGTCDHDTQYLFDIVDLWYTPIFSVGQRKLLGQTIMFWVTFRPQTTHL